MSDFFMFIAGSLVFGVIVFEGFKEFTLNAHLLSFIIIGFLLYLFHCERLKELKKGEKK